MTTARKKTMSLIYNGAEVWGEIGTYVQNFSYTDNVDQSDTISFTITDRDLKWVDTWFPKQGDVISPCVLMEHWNYEGEKRVLDCGTFVVDDFSFQAPPLCGSINGVSAPVNSCFKETINTKTWKDATVRLIAAELASKYSLSLVYEASEIPIAKIEQSQQADSEFLKKICEKYGLGFKVYTNRLVIWDYRNYYTQTPTITLTPKDVSKWSYHSTMQGVYTGARVSYTNPKTKKTVDVLVGTEERLYKTTQKADNEADARLIGEGAILKANRKKTTMQLTFSPWTLLFASKTVRLSEFGQMDGIYFVESVKHSLSKGSYTLQVQLSFVSEDKEVKTDGQQTETAVQNQSYVVQNGDTLWDLAERFLGKGSRCTELYQANQAVIEAEAKKHGKKDSNNGYWIWKGTVLTIP